MNIAMLIIGIVLILASIITVVISIVRTPSNLRGFYGVMYIVIGIIAFAGGAALIVFSLL